MSDSYAGEIRMFAGTFAPAGWLDCDGQLLQISAYPTLFNLIGTTYGGDGQSTFALPNLQSRVAVGTGGTMQLGMTGGAETVTISSQQVPLHVHPLMSTTSGQQQSPANAVPASTGSYNVYGPKTTPTTLISASVGNSGGTGPHNNIQPYLGMRYIISTDGQSPPR